MASIWRSGRMPMGAAFLTGAATAAWWLSGHPWVASAVAVGAMGLMARFSGRTSIQLEELPVAAAILDLDMRQLAGTKDWEAISREPGMPAMLRLLDADVVEAEVGVRWLRLERRPWPKAEGQRGWFVSASDVTERKLLEARLRGSIAIDLVTGLPSRAAVVERLRTAIASGVPYAVMVIDVDRFKVVNTSLGHADADELLRQIGTRLRVFLSQRRVEGDDPVFTPARLVGDQFVVLVERLGEEPSRALAGALLTCIRQPFLLAGTRMGLTASIGLVAGDPRYISPHEVIRDADAAVAVAKDRGKNQIALFDEGMHSRARRRLQLEVDLRQAIERNELTLEYQPIVSLQDGRMVGAEALVRWSHPLEGDVPPAEFVALAEESCLILPLGDWVVRTALWQLARFQAEGNEDFRMSINLARQQLMCAEFIERLPQYVADAGVSPADVQFEITESTVMRDLGASRAALASLLMGFRIAIDDFGTGYSSLSCLHQFPVDVLKLDRELTLHLERGQEYVGMVNAIMLLAWNLGVQVVAEGVETLDQVQMLQGLNCHYGQGYYFGKAVTAESLFLRRPA